MQIPSKLALAALWVLVLGFPAQADEAVFAGGCFWCMEEAFERIDGVSEVISGYAGGHLEDPGYRQVVSGRTGHAEVVKVIYDPDVVSYQDLLQKFWLNIDPTVRNRQFCDSGNQYRTAIFAVDSAQLELAEASKVAVQAQKPFDGPIETEIAELDRFYPAETYHQDYYRKNPLRYKSYKYACGRAQRLDDLWGDADRAFELEGS